jgi:uncharacterized protein (DUF305 family)
MARRGAKLAKQLSDAHEAAQMAAPPSPSPAPRMIDRTMIVDAPPSPERHRIDTQFVNVESDHYQRAHEMARQQIARRYPGAQEIIESELHLTRQFAAGLPVI